LRRIELKFVFGEYWRSRSGVDPDDPDLTFNTKKPSPGLQGQTMFKRTDSLPCFPRVAGEIQLPHQTLPISFQSDGAMADLSAVRRLPLPVAAISQFSTPGACVGAVVHGIKVLLTSGDGISVRAFAPGGAAEDGAEIPEDVVQELPCVKRLGLVWVIAVPRTGFDWDAYFGALGAEMMALGFDDNSLGIHQRSFVQPSNWKRVLQARLDSQRSDGDARGPTRAPAAPCCETAVREAAGDHQRIVKRRRSAVAHNEPGARAGCIGNSEFIYLFFPCTLMVWDGDHYNMVTVSPGSDGQSCAVNSWMMVPGQFRWRAAEHWERNDKLFWGVMSQDFFRAAVNQQVSAASAMPGANERHGDASFALFKKCLKRHAPPAC
jgi:hypothetical protein